MREKMAKHQLYEKRYNFEANQDLWFKSGRDIFETGVHIVLNIQFLIFWTDWEITRQTELQSDR